ncbi:MAG: HlyD family efflux transporter periplasmic adaptor subunit [Pseudomonadota bacterium]
MRFLRRSLMGLFLLAVTVSLLGLAGNTVRSAIQDRLSEEAPNRPQRERVFAANVVTVEPQTIAPVITTFGEIGSRRTLELRASAAGEIVWRSDMFENGAEVSAGDPLIRIDAQDAMGRRDSAQADLSEAEADVRDARRDIELSKAEVEAAEDQVALRQRALTRQLDLQERGVGSAAAVEAAELEAQSARQAVLSRRQALAQAETRADQAMTGLERRRIALDEAERRVAETVLVAAFDGILVDVSTVAGGLVSQNERVAELIDPDALEVSFRVSAGQYARLLDEAGRLPDAEVTVSLDVADVDIVAEGRITRESPAVGEGQTGRELFARLDSAPGFRPGDFVTVRITEPELPNVAVLPATALDAAGRVLVIGEDDRLEVGETRLLRRQGDDVLVRARGLAGREVVAERTPFLGAGIRVRPIRPGGEEAPQQPSMVELDADRRAALIAFVEGNQRMPADAKERVLAALQQDKVPAQMVERIESRMGG